MQDRSPIKTQRRWLDLLQPSIDAAAIIASLSFVSWTADDEVSNLVLGVSMVAVIVFSLLSHLSGLHRRIQHGTANNLSLIHI